MSSTKQNTERGSDRQSKHLKRLSSPSTVHTTSHTPMSTQSIKPEQWSSPWPPISGFTWEVIRRLLIYSMHSLWAFIKYFWLVWTMTILVGRVESSTIFQKITLRLEHCVPSSLTLKAIEQSMQDSSPLAEPTNSQDEKL